MLKTGIILFTALFFLISCGNSKEGSEGNLSASDSMKLASKSYADLLVDLAASKNIADVLCQGWMLEDDMEIIKYDGSAQGEYPVRSFYFETDFTFIKTPRNKMEYGTWSYSEDKKLITLSYSNGAKEVYKIAAITATELFLVQNDEQKKQKFIGSGKRHKDKMTDPYYIENNRWRIQPTAAETDEQIKKRLKDCLHFYILFYSDNLAKANKHISFYGFPTCVKWYEGGIRMVKKTELAENWYKCFYNAEQALKARGMMEDIIVKKYTWSKERISWVIKNLLVLEQMYANL